jgi:hypothetical protein
VSCDPLSNLAEFQILFAALGIGPTSSIIQRGPVLPTASATSPWFFVLSPAPDVLYVKMKITGDTWDYVYLQGAP